MKPRTYKHHIEILPAALLSQQQAWQEAAQALPTGACLLITDPNNREQGKLMEMLTHSFRDRGKRVVVWPIDQDAARQR